MTEHDQDRTRPPAAFLGVTFVYLCAIVLVTLYPWQAWRPWSSLNALALAYLVEPWPRYWTAFDFVTNLLAYVPLGALLVVVLLRRFGMLAALTGAVLACALLSLVLETLQILLPGRVPSRADWAANVLGGAGGAMLATLIGRRRLSHWPALLRSALPFARGSTVGLLLLGAWFAAQFYPQSMTFATGDLLDALTTWLGDDAPAALTERIGGAYATLAEAGAVALTVVAIGMIVIDLLRPGVNAAAPVAVAIAIAALAKASASAWLLGSGAGFAWVSAGAQGGVLVGALATALLAWLGPRTRLRAAAVALLLATALFNSAGPNPYFNSMMALWDQGPWVNINGLLSGLAMVWPFAAITYCALRHRSRKSRP